MFCFPVINSNWYRVEIHAPIACWSLGTIEKKTLRKAQKDMLIQLLSVSGTSHSAWHWTGHAHKAGVFKLVLMGTRRRR